MTTPDSVIVRPSQQKVNISWLDVNTQMGTSIKPDLLPDVMAINNSLFNLFSCPVKSRGPIFQPEYGTIFYRILHEPMDNFTANKIRVYTIQAVQRWEPRIVLDMANTGVSVNYMLPGYVVRITYSVIANGAIGVADLQMSIGV